MVPVGEKLSVILPLIFAGLGRIAAVQQKDTPFWRLMRKRWVRWTLYGIVFCNIAEATLRDMQMGNMMNALAGFILCVTMPFGDKYWKYDTSSHGEILSYTVPMWNFLYTTWNACFVYAEGHEFFASTCCILLRPSCTPSSCAVPSCTSPGASTRWARTSCCAAASRRSSPPS